MADIIYPYKKYNYKVLLDNSEEAGFSEVSSPDITSDPVEYREGNMTGKTAGKQPGILKHFTGRAVQDHIIHPLSGRLDKGAHAFRSQDGRRFLILSGASKEMQSTASDTADQTGSALFVLCHIL